MVKCCVFFAVRSEFLILFGRVSGFRVKQWKLFYSHKKLTQKLASRIEQVRLTEAQRFCFCSSMHEGKERNVFQDWRFHCCHVHFIRFPAPKRKALNVILAFHRIQIQAAETATMLFRTNQSDLIWIRLDSESGGSTESVVFSHAPLDVKAKADLFLIIQQTSAIKMKTVRFSKKLVPAYESTRRYHQEDQHQHLHRRGNLKSHNRSSGRKVTQLKITIFQEKQI
jgi:hypothetical protein